MLNFVTTVYITLSVVLLLDNAMPHHVHNVYACFFKYSGTIVALSQRMEIIYLVFETLNSMSCVDAKLSHFSNISTRLALDGVNSVMSSSLYKYCCK